MELNIITRCTRVHNLPILKDNVFKNIYDIKINWHVVFDVGILKDIDASILYDITKDGNVYPHFIPSGNWGLKSLNSLIESLDDWIYFLDDDNILHEDFYYAISNFFYEYQGEKLGFIFSQWVGGKDFSGLMIREAKPENVKVQKIDLAQYLLHRDLFTGSHWFGESYTADGIFIEKLYDELAEEFHIENRVLCYYNYLQKDSRPALPKILFIGSEKPEIKSSQHFCDSTDELDVKYISTDDALDNELNMFKPDAIVSYSNDWRDYKKLANQNYQIRKKWLHTDTLNDDLGQHAYNCAMSQLLNNDTSTLISYFTPIYNTGSKLHDTYQCLVNQTNPDWEWVLVNDSTDGGKTLKIAEDIAAKDHRVKVYDFRVKSGGNIGEVKYRAAMLCRGHLLVELDHDDHIVPDLTTMLHDASIQKPECGFFYTDCAEVDENWNPLNYGDSWAFDYGSYRQEMYNGKLLWVCNQHNINPVTIRHIVGVPNHVRAWRRSTYLELGGHCRDLTIADDYELIVRTFLHTKMCRIPKLGYVQFLYNNQSGRNSHDIARGDIQRRVRSIATHYHIKIKNRFDELGLHDWAFEKNPNDPITSWYGPWPKGEEEQIANETL